MKIEEQIFNNEKYYLINEYNFKFGKVYKFANVTNTIFCREINGRFVIINDRKMLKKIQNTFTKLEIKDIV
ncbi:MAG TPA: hypothetical protein IAD08_08460 [Candidatus Scatovivens faecipullorum]|nr:hypothetical protein [Candidatus Scatovivens faecipullorum]